MNTPDNNAPSTPDVQADLNAPQGVYLDEATPELASFMSVVDERNAQIQALKDDQPELWQTILGKLRVDWTYHSNTLEGSTLTRGETLFFLNEGLTVEGKPFKDFVDAQNHAEAIDFLHDVVALNREVSEGLIKEINALLLHGLKDTPAINAQGQRVSKPAHPGQYKKQPNHVQQADGSIHWYVEPLQVPDQMSELVDWINNPPKNIHPMLVAALAHYNLVRIHPFDDGNGRGARILMNLILMQHGYFPAVIRTERKRAYLDALKTADQGDSAPFIQFIATELAETMERVIADLQSKPS